jgi:PadR family transcriptional regulator PadR
MMLPSTIQGKRVAAENLDLLQGTLDLLVLKTVAWEPMHGYAVSRWISRATDDDLQIEEGALYTALHRLEKKGMLASEWGVSENNRKAKFYRLTAAGRRQLATKTEVWTRYAGAVTRVLQFAR